jgi:type I restriction enzyme S subunit
MEVKPGYKQTEAGVIPAEWDVARITDVADVKTGPFGSALHERDYVYNGTPIITVEHLGELGVIGINLPQVSNADRKRLRAYLLDAGDIVFSRVGSVDRNALIRESEAGWLFSGRLLRVRPNKTKVYAPFLSFQFHSELFKRRVYDVAVGQTMASINTQILRNIIIILPILKEQFAIGTALSDLDALIASLNKLIDKKRDLKQAAMQQLLSGQTRLPGFSGECEVKRLGKIAEIKKGQLITEKHAIVGTIPVIAGGRTPAYFHNRANRTGKTITVSASGANAGFVAFHDVPIFASDCSTINESPAYSIEFIFFQLLLLQGLIYKAQTGGAQPHIHPVDLMPLEVHLPPLPEQNAIAVVLSDMDAEIAALEQRLAKTRDLKLGMMQELLTGRTRLVKLSQTKET